MYHLNPLSALLQYRMSSGIMELSNSLIYGNRLCCGSLEIANAKLKFSGRETVQLKLKEAIFLSLKFSISTQLKINSSCMKVSIKQCPFNSSVQLLIADLEP